MSSANSNNANCIQSQSNAVGAYSYGPCHPSATAGIVVVAVFLIAVMATALAI